MYALLGRLCHQLGARQPQYADLDLNGTDSSSSTHCNGVSKEALQNGQHSSYAHSKASAQDATAFYIFMDEAMKTAIENLEDLKEARVKAREHWKKREK